MGMSENDFRMFRATVGAALAFLPVLTAYALLPKESVYINVEALSGILILSAETLLFTAWARDRSAR
jgi:hypothetical protein